MYNVEAHPGGTTGSVKLTVPVAVWTLLAIPNELWKTSLTRYKLNIGGSVGSGVHEMVAGPALVKLLGVVKVRALTSGARKANTLRIGNTR